MNKYKRISCREKMKKEYKVSQKFIDWAIENRHLKLEKEEIWNKIFDIDKTNSMSIRFIGVLIYNSDSDNYDEAIREWVELKQADNSSDCCICSHEIKLNILMEHVTGPHRTIIVGSYCIYKFGTEEMKEDLRIIEKMRNYIGDKKMCKNCCHYRILLTDTNRSFCRKCDHVISKRYCKRNELNYETKCFGCDNIVNINENSLHCKDCKDRILKEQLRIQEEKKIIMLQNNYRQCITCSKYNILINKAPYMKRCKPCWYKFKQF